MKRNKGIALLLVVLLMVPFSFALPAKGETVIEVSTWEELNTALNSNLSGETIRLKNSIYGQVTPDIATDYTDESAYTTMNISGNCILDLNGFTLGASGSTETDYIVLLAVAKTGAVIIKNGTLSAPQVDATLYNGGKTRLEQVWIEGYNGVINDGQLLMNQSSIRSRYGLLHYEGQVLIRESEIRSVKGHAIRLITANDVTLTSGVFSGHPTLDMDDGKETLQDIVDLENTFITGDTYVEPSKYPKMKKLEGEVHLIPAHAISLEPADSLAVHWDERLDSYPEGQDVELDIFIPEGKELESLKVNGEDVTAEVLNVDVDLAYYIFLMPKEDVQILASFADVEEEKNGYTLTLKPEGHLTADQKDLTDIPGDTEVTVTITPPEGKELGTLLVDSGDVTEKVAEDQYTFKMPAKDIEIVAAFKDATKEEPQKGFLMSVFTIDKEDLHINENGKSRIEKMDVAPYIRNDRTMLPVRFVGQSLNMEVTFDEATRDVWVKDDTRSVRLNLDNSIVTTGAAGRPYILDSKPEVIAGRTMLPIGEIADILGFSRTDQYNPGGYLTWDGELRTVTIMVATENKA